MTGWSDLTEELDRWQADGRTATFWWRDDDAVAPSDALQRLLAISARHAAGLALAVIPETCQNALAAALATPPRPAGAEVAVFQHGIAHRNQASPGEKKTELSAAVPLDEAVEHLKAGKEKLSALFGKTFLPVLVPPWNRIAPVLMPQLSACGFIGLSTYKTRAQLWPAPGLLQVNTHADLLRWRPERGFLGESEVLTLLQAHLRARRRSFERSKDNSAALGLEPTGILTHHLVHDEATWVFLEELLSRLNRHPATKLLAPSEAFFHAEANDGTPDPASNRTAGAPDPKIPEAHGVKTQQPTRKGRA